VNFDDFVSFRPILPFFCRNIPKRIWTKYILTTNHWTKPSRRCNNHGWARTADWPRASWNCDTYTRCRWPDLTCLSMDVRDCIPYRNALQHFIHLRSSSKRLYHSIRDMKASKVARKSNRNTKQNSPSNIAHTRRTGSLLTVSRGLLYFDNRTHAYRTITGCVPHFTVMK